MKCRSGINFVPLMAHKMNGGEKLHKTIKNHAILKPSL